MSLHAVKWAMAQQIDDATLQAVLTVLAEAEKKGVCSITQPEIASHAALKERAVRNALALLESFEVIVRTKGGDWRKRGRAADAITLALDRHFDLEKAVIKAARKHGYYRHQMPLVPTDLPAPDAGSPKSVPTDFHYRERARGVECDGNHKETSPNCRTIVWFERGRQRWRARITVDGLTLNLGRFDTKADADAYAIHAKANAIKIQSKEKINPSPMGEGSRPFLDD